MSVLAYPAYKWDRMAIGLSGLCLVHCLGTTIVLALLSSAGSMIGDGWVHELGLVLAMAMGAVALGKGIYEHGYAMPSSVGGLGLGIMAGALALPHGSGEALYTVIGVTILAFGHRLNHIAAE